MQKIGSILMWIFVYAVVLAFIIDFPVLMIALYTGIYIIIFAIFEPITRAGFGNFPSGKDSGVINMPGVDETIKTMLEYYEEREVVEWCMKNYNWDVEKATKRVSEVAQKLEKCGK